MHLYVFCGSCRQTGRQAGRQQAACSMQQTTALLNSFYPLNIVDIPPITKIANDGNDDNDTIERKHHKKKKRKSLKRKFTNQIEDMQTDKS